MNYKTLPFNMRESMKLYLEEGIQPGNFLYNILINDFAAAVRSSDSVNKHYLLMYANFLNNAPLSCWGSEQMVRDWMRLGGLRGNRKAAA